MWTLSTWLCSLHKKGMYSPGSKQQSDKDNCIHHLQLHFNVHNTFRIVVDVGSCTLFLIRRHRWYPVKKYATAKNITISCDCTLLRSLRMSSFTDCINTENTHINQSNSFCFTLLIIVIIIPNTNPNHKQITSHYSTTGCQAKCFHILQSHALSITMHHLFSYTAHNEQSAMPSHWLHGIQQASCTKVHQLHGTPHPPRGIRLTALSHWLWNMLTIVTAL